MRNNLLLALLSALFLSLPWLGLGSYTVLIGLIPILIISDSLGKGKKNFWKVFGWIALALGAWSAVTTWWIWYAAPIGAILSVIITIVLFGGVFVIYHWVSKRAPKPLAYTLLVAGWIAAEYLYTVGEISFPWLILGNAFSGDIKLIQWYDTFGVFGGSLWIWIVNIAIYSAITFRSKKNVVIASFILLVPISASLIRYYTYQEKGDDVIVTVVQPNLDPYEEKFVLSQEVQTSMLLDMAKDAPSDVDYIIMPETAIDDNLLENYIANNPIIDRFRATLKDNFPQAQIITGVTTYYQYMSHETPSVTARTHDNVHYYDVYNSALAIDTSKNVQIHHKTELVIGVEKMPYMELLKPIESLIVDLGGTVGRLGADSVLLPFTNSKGVKSAVPICYEAVYGETTAEFVANGAQIMFIISNDGWWSDTQGHRHLFKFSRLRAIETRRSIGRSANTGTSGFINQRGDVLQKEGWDVRTNITETIKTNDHITFYTRFGDLVARISSYVFFLCILYYIAIAYRRRNLM